MKSWFPVLIFLISSTAFAQKSTYQGFPSLVWPKLYDISFITATDGLGDYQKPIFTEGVKSLHNKQVILPGYMVPLENARVSDEFMLSSLPLNACFFCGVGGPETVVAVRLKSKTPYIEKPIEIRGKLRLNDQNPDEMIYVLEEAEILGTLDF